jgi:hypothetical protein
MGIGVTARKAVLEARKAARAKALAEIEAEEREHDREYEELHDNDDDAQIRLLEEIMPRLEVMLEATPDPGTEAMLAYGRGGNLPAHQRYYFELQLVQQVVARAQDCRREILRDKEILVDVYCGRLPRGSDCSKCGSQTLRTWTFCRLCLTPVTQPA